MDMDFDMASAEEDEEEEEKPAPRTKGRKAKAEGGEDESVVKTEVMAVIWAQWVTIGSVGEVDYNVERTVTGSDEGGGCGREEEIGLWKCAFRVVGRGSECRFFGDED